MCDLVSNPAECSLKSVDLVNSLKRPFWKLMSNIKSCSKVRKFEVSVITRR